MQLRQVARVSNAIPPLQVNFAEHFIQKRNRLQFISDEHKHESPPKRWASRSQWLPQVDEFCNWLMTEEVEEACKKLAMVT
jgi:hypothetical protein